MTQIDTPSRKPLRLWSGVVGAVAVVLGLFVLPAALPDLFVYGMIGSLAGGLVVAVWWVFLSRAPWAERLGAIALAVVAVFAMKRIVDPSIAGAGMSMMLPLFSIPVVGLGLVAGAVVGRRSAAGRRRASIAIGILLASSSFALVRTGGISGAGVSDLHWRWTPTPEDRLLARAEEEPKPPPIAPPTAAPESPREPAAPVPAAPEGAKTSAQSAPPPAGEESAAPPAPAAAAKPAEWPGFRGPNRDDIIRGVRIETDWTRSPPVQLWRRPIGPGWSSFAVDGDVLYTQEQRGEDEIVAAYRMSTGEPVWRHRDPVRFYESNGGAGPRSTPTLSNGHVYTFGATGVVNALNARDGSIVWSRNAANDTHKKVPEWGFASSPVVADDVVIIAATGTLLGYEVATGKPRWVGPAHKGGYTSPHRVTIDGIEQILLLTADGVSSVAPATGKIVWEHAWPGVPIVQPAMIADGDILLSTLGDATGAIGMRRIAAAHGPGGWTVEERWTSNALKPYFNDFVVHKGHAFGFDNSILACIGLEDGKRTWKGGRYGHGQLLLLPDQDVLLVLSEEGELALIAAAPDQFKEIARFPALEGKTWNHPVLVGDVLLVRNDHEMAAFRLSLASP